MKHPHASHHGTGSFFVFCILLGVILATSRPVLAQTTRIIFLHHSCGHNLIEQGGVREGLTALDYEFYDHGYNGDGLRLADGSHTGTNFDVPGDNTDPDGFAEIFRQPLHDPPDNTFSHLMQYDVIAFKSCFPVSNIADDYQLNEYKSHYLSIRDRIEQYPDKIFIIVTQPPQVPPESNSDEAARARAFTVWLQSDEYLAGHPNLFVFDFFGHLAGDDNFLRPEYRLDEYDAHPNERANRDIAPLFVAFVDRAIRSYSVGEPRPTPAAPTPTAEQVEPSPTPTPMAPTPTSEGVTQPPSGVMDDFESPLQDWHSSSGAGSTFECATDIGEVHGGTASLRLSYDIAPDGWGDCGRSFESLQDWSSGTGLSLWLRSDEAGQWVTLMLFAGEFDNPTPFEVRLEGKEGWTQVVLPWADFRRAEWADEGGLSEVDPTRVLGYAFSVDAGETSTKGILWIDDLSLFTGEPQKVSPTPTATPVQPAATPTPAATVTPPPPTATSAPDATATPLPPTATPAPVPTSVAEEKPRGGFCPFSALVLPLGAMMFVWLRRPRNFS